jgi:ABC-type bacteriocin/lantibiotic exporter with double-glycine peptidase domain
MKLQVPFYKQTTPANCGPYTLKMVFSFLGKDFPIEEIEEKSRIKEGKGVSTLHLAVAALDLGFKVRFFSKYEDVNQENLGPEFYRSLMEEDYLAVVRNLIKEIKSKSAEVEIKSIGIDELLSYVTENSIPIVLMDWNTIKGRKEKGYYGHFVPVVGYDQENI